VKDIGQCKSRPRRTFGRTQHRVRVLLLNVDATEDAVSWYRELCVSCVLRRRRGVAHSFKPLRRSGPKSCLKAESIIVGFWAYVSEQGQ